MSDTTRDTRHKFWDQIGDILNTVLFRLIRLEAVTVRRDAGLILAVTYAIVLCTVILQGGAIAGILQRLERKGTNAT